MKKDKPTEVETPKLILGPTVILRAPTLIVGKNMVVGFNEAIYADVLG